MSGERDLGDEVSLEARAILNDPERWARIEGPLLSTSTFEDFVVERLGVWDQERRERLRHIRAEHLRSVG